MTNDNPTGIDDAEAYLRSFQEKPAAAAALISIARSLERIADVLADTETRATGESKPAPTTGSDTPHDA